LDLIPSFIDRKLDIHEEVITTGVRRANLPSMYQRLTGIATIQELPCATQPLTFAGNHKHVHCHKLWQHNLASAWILFTSSATLRLIKSL
jgi:hypothetical protein